MGVREVNRHLEKHSTLCYFDPHYRCYLEYRITTTKLYILLKGVYFALVDKWQMWGLLLDCVGL